MTFFCSALLMLVAVLPAPKQVPPPGVPVSEKDRKELEAGVALLGAEMEKLRDHPLLPDVAIFHKAVDWALRYNEMFDAKQIAIAKAQLDEGRARAAALANGQTPWLTQTGLVVRGYRSQVDGSVQPYGLFVPPDWTPDDRRPRRLDFWLHGRNEKLTELAFLDSAQKNPPPFTPPGAFVCQLYGRFCNANKFAGERDLFEAWEHIRAAYPIDNDRVTVRGFSMGGAACWHFATHHAGCFAAAAPGAGFAETGEYSHALDEGKEPPPPWEQTLWRWYDATVYAANLANVPLVAYSGELDKQKQAADIMLRFAGREGLSFLHLIGPQTAHKYHPDAKPKIEEFVTAAAVKGRDPLPKQVRFTTYTLIYPSMRWVRIEAMEKHWERADVIARLEGDTVIATTRNVAAVRFDVGQQAVLDGQKLNGNTFHKANGRWQTGTSPAAGKRPGVCGPIDHAFLSQFLHVRPTGQPFHTAVGAWTQAEMELARSEWRRVFRGEAPVKDDTAVTDADIAAANLVLWGDPSSNALLRRIADKLPLRWTKDTLEWRGHRYDAACHAPILIFPNPLNPNRYVVLNSGHTFRADANASNALQTPKLPDWAVVDLREPPGAHSPGKIVAAGFFDEQWRWP